MIQEAYCSEEVYKLLMEKGYKGTNSHYISSREDLHLITHQCATAWLREKYDLYVDIHTVPTTKGKPAFVCMVSDYSWATKPNPNTKLYDGCIRELKDGFSSYEDACEYGIQWCLRYFL